MDFSFTEEQLEIAEGARAFLQGESPVERLRKLVDGREETNDLWPQIADMGLLGVMAPEDKGGLGFGAPEFALIAEAAGSVALPEPLVEAGGLVAPVLSSLGAPELADMLAGKRRIALAHDANPFVNLADAASDILVMTPERTALVSVDDVLLSPRVSVDPLRRLFSIRADADAGRTLAEGKEAAALFEATRAHGAVFASAEMAGLAGAMIAQATAYAKEREQFGVPIGGFQAVKHHLASAYAKLEFARPVVYYAAALLDGDPGRRDLAAAQAQRAASGAAIFAAETAIQVHGAMGYTYEVDLHLWMKRAWALAGLWGGRGHTEKFIEDRLFSGAVPTGPGASFDPISVESA